MVILSLLFSYVFSILNFAFHNQADYPKILGPGYQEAIHRNFDKTRLNKNLEDSGLVINKGYFEFTLSRNE
jgi:hypothetical protein